MARRLTKEHLVSRWLLARTSDYTSKFLDAAPSGAIGGEPTIRDVCGVCNGGVLSQLDSYLCTLYDHYFCADVSKGEQVSFEYDHNLLSRWLLKTSFNVARTINGSDAPELEVFVPYIMGGGAPRQLAVFLQLMSPSILTPAGEAVLDDEMRDRLPREDGHRLIPTHMFRVARSVTASQYARLLIRLVSINAYCFYLVIPRADSMLPTEWEQLRSNFGTTLQGAVQLTPDSSPVTLTRSGNDILTSRTPSLIANLDRLTKAGNRTKDAQS